MQFTRQLQRAVLALAFVSSLGTIVLAQTATQAVLPSRAEEFQVKAAFLYNFVKFAKWPEAGDRTDEPIRLGIFGEDPFGLSFDESLSAKLAHGRPIQVVRMRTLARLEVCHLLYISPSASDQVEQILAVLQGSPVLIVGDQLEPLNRGVTINLTVDQRKVRFDVNAAAARRSGLVLSSHLLRLARRVEGSKGGSRAFR